MAQNSCGTLHQNCCLYATSIDGPITSKPLRFPYRRQVRFPTVGVHGHTKAKVSTRIVNNEPLHSTCSTRRFLLADLARAVNYRNGAAPLTALRLCLHSAIKLILCLGFAANVFSAQYSSTKSTTPSKTPSEVDERRDALACRPKQCHLEFEDGQIRVLRVTLDG